MVNVLVTKRLGLKIVSNDEDYERVKDSVNVVKP
jgi:predicted nucleic acid-binding protein